ncbi:MAG: GNAT family N-acetyltransferase [Flavobacteriaceae bacterium]
MENNHFISGERIYLRLLKLTDLEGNYVSWLNDPIVSQNNSHHIFPYSKESAEKFIKDAYVQKDKLVLAVCVKDNNVHIGNISLQKIDFFNQTAEFAIMLGEKEYWGKGYSKEAAELIIHHGFNTMNLRRIYCGTFENNVSMQKLAKYLNFAQEGRRREAFFKNGNFIDIVEFGLLKKEFYNKFNII